MKNTEKIKINKRNGRPTSKSQGKKKKRNLFAVQEEQKGKYSCQNTGTPCEVLSYITNLLLKDIQWKPVRTVINCEDQKIIHKNFQRIK